jgi:hypothetical protein
MLVKSKSTEKLLLLLKAFKYARPEFLLRITEITIEWTAVEGTACPWISIKLKEPKQ